MLIWALGFVFLGLFFLFIGLIPIASEHPFAGFLGLGYSVIGAVFLITGAAVDCYRVRYKAWLKIEQARLAQSVPPPAPARPAPDTSGMTQPAIAAELTLSEEDAAWQIMNRAKQLNRAGMKDEAAADLSALVKSYPNTEAGRIARRSLQKSGRMA